MTIDMHDGLDRIDEQAPVDGEAEATGWFTPMPVEDEPLLYAGLCNVCAHPIYRVGYDYRCTEGCRCLMLGCVQRLEDRA